MTTTLADAKALEKIVRKSGKVLALTWISAQGGALENPRIRRQKGAGMAPGGPQLPDRQEPEGAQTRYSKGNDNLSKEARAAARLIGGHPDGYIEAFAKIYREAFKGVKVQGKPGKRGYKWH
ncbi:MAG TPA: hypothetical protein VJ385_14700 [Fibrobacteria bacterium]|nr:hypothetical protein [Fibrobacteria bacterium]